MCGIVAVINAIPNVQTGSYAASKVKDMFENMMLASAVRGTDGTGLFQVDGDEKVWHGKTQLPSAMGVYDKKLSGIMSNAAESAITVGHVRAATAGSVSKDNAHPFTAVRDDGSYIIGVHNGSLYGWDTPASGFEVDSEWALDLIAREGVEKAFSEIWGAYCFLWYDSKEPGKLFFLRNEDRPMHIARTKDKKTIIMASEAGMLQWLADKHNIGIEEVLSVDEDYLMSIDFRQETLCVDVVQKVESNYSSSHYHGWHSAGTNKTPSSAVPKESSLKSYVVSAVKTCLKNARMSLYRDEEEDADTPFEMGPIPSEQGWGDAKADWYDSSFVSDAEKKRAMSEGLYGRIVMYEPVTYDVFTKQMVGEITYPTKLKNPLAYIPDLDPEEADTYLNRMMNMVVVGARTFGKETEYVLAELNDKGQQALAA